MKRSLLNAPVLHAMRAFGASARHLSFARAAQELHVTPGAVSQQIKLLEDRLGVQLFNRLPRGIELTTQGSMLALAVESSFSTLEEALAALAPRADNQQVLTISCTTSFALIWLIPRLGAFNAVHPGFQLRVKAEFDHVNPDGMRREGTQLAIRYDVAPYPGFDKVELMDELLQPVASPEFLARHPPEEFLRNPDGRFMLHDASPWDGAPPLVEWADWLDGASDRLDVSALRQASTAGHQFNLSQLCLQAAAAGHGIAMGRRALIQDDLASGRLVAPWDIAVPSRARYVLLALPGERGAPAIAPFVDWLAQQCAAGSDSR